MAATVHDVKAALSVAVATIAGLRAYAYQPDQVNAPMSWPILDEIRYHDAMGGGLVTQQYRIAVIVGRAAERTAQKNLDAYLSYGAGIRFAIESDPTLGGVAQASIVESATNISSIDAGDTTYLYVEFRVTVYA